MADITTGPTGYAEACCFNEFRDGCRGEGCPCACHPTTSARRLDVETARALGETTALGPGGRWQIVSGHGDVWALPHYSTDIAAAWTVVERCTALDGLGYRQVRGLPVATRFMAHFEAAALWSCTAGQAAERICLAALAAMAGEPVTLARGGRREAPDRTV